ncbi:MAG: ZIP family metal transporter [Candidatus Pacebacteria bacterium]|nr:ZIP family metal transporter [Candidatus Paceibacterota bacterium]
MTITLIALSALIATLLGGLFALRLRDKLHLILGFSAGAVIAVAFFDLIPEALELGAGFYSNNTILTIVAIGFIAYLILDRVVFLHAHAHEDEEGGSHDAHAVAHNRGILGAASLSVHSFLDGIAIGLAFQVSAAVGIVVTIAVLTHDFSDGINTVSMILKNGGTRIKAFRWLIVDAVAPVLGIISTLFFTVSAQGLALILALFSGFFLYIGASDLVPESHHAHPKFLTTAMTILGAGVLYLAISVI